MTVEFDNVALTTEDFVEQSDAWMEQLDALVATKEAIERSSDLSADNVINYNFKAISLVIAGLALLVGRENGKALRTRG